MKHSRPTDSSTTPPPASPEPGAQTIEELRLLQALMAGAVMRPLTADEAMQSTWVDGQPMEGVAGSFIKPNDRLTSFERLELYNRQYWFRVLDCFYEDYPGLIRVLGGSSFERLALAYLDETPSRSFTLRNLGQRLVEFLEGNPEHLGVKPQLALDMARLEWAHIEAFDNEGLEPVSADDLLGGDSGAIRLRLQPYLTLLQLRYPIDTMLVAIRRSEEQSELRQEASNAAGDRGSKTEVAAYELPEAEELNLAVHRYDNTVFYKRLRRDELAILSALRDGKTLGEAIAEGAEFVEEGALDDWPEQLRASFENWTSLAWLVLPEDK